jgi:hypothetical protein
MSYKNKKTGDVYLVETACHLKIGDNWVKGIAYFNENNLREMFVRTEEDFSNAFEEIEEDE